MAHTQNRTSTFELPALEFTTVTTLQAHSENPMSAYPVLVPKPVRPASVRQPFQNASSTLDEADIDRFATLFSPATPPATPTLTATPQQPLFAVPTTRPRKSTQGSADSDFGAFVSVPPSQDPLLHEVDSAGPSASNRPAVSAAPAGNTNFFYFDQFTANAKSAAERSKRDVLDELLHHQDDPMYFLNTQTPPPVATPQPPCSTPTPPPAASPIPIPMSTDDAIAEALASDMTNPKLIRVERGGSVKVALGPSRTRMPLPPRLSGSASPPSIDSPTGSTTSLPMPSPPLPLQPYSSASTSALASASSSQPAQATLSRISSSLVSLLPSGRPRSTAPVPPSSAPSAPSSISRFSSPFASTTVTHGSPFASTPYIPPTGAPGFAGDRVWDRGFSGALEHDEKRGLVDPIGLGLGFGGETEGVAGHSKRGKGKSVVLVGRREGTARVLHEELADLLRPHLPALTKLPRHWTLLYSLDQHGISLNTLYARSEPRVPSRAHPNPPQGGLVVVQDACDAVFGAWVGEGISVGREYYGSGEAFLWRYHPPVGEGGGHQGQGQGQGKLDVYKWTGKNDYVALCEPGFISFGGGDGHYGLYLDQSLLDGSSAPCPTFDNPPLCASPPPVDVSGVTKARGDVQFECVGLEVWGVGEW